MSTDPRCPDFCCIAEKLPDCHNLCGAFGKFGEAIQPGKFSGEADTWPWSRYMHTAATGGGARRQTGNCTQAHYDFGLRNILAVLRTAGKVAAERRLDLTTSGSL